MTALLNNDSLDIAGTKTLFTVLIHTKKKTQDTTTDSNKKRILHVNN